MAAIVGSLLVTAEARLGQFSSGMHAMARQTRSATGRVRQDLDRTNRSVTRLNASMGSRVGGRGILIASRNLETAASRANLLRMGILSLSGAFGGLAAALGLNSVMATIDAYTSLRNQLKTVIADENIRIAVEERLYNIAQRSRAGLKETAVLYTRLNRATKALNLSHTELLSLTETIMKGFVVGGATTAEASSFAIQFSQALASNRLQGEELRTILETPLGGILAKGMNVDIGTFRKMAKDGELTAAKLVKSLKVMKGEIDDLFSRTTPTIGQGLTVLDNAFTKYIGTNQSVLGVTQTLSTAMLALADNIEVVMDVAVLAGGALAAKFLGRGIAGFVGPRAGALRAELQMRQASLASARASVEEASALRNLTAAKLRDAQATNMRMVMTNAGAKAVGRSSAEVARLHAQLGTANTAVRANVAALTAAEGAMTRFSRVSFLARTAIGGLIGFLGGPLGAALTAAFVGFSLLNSYESQAERAAREHGEVVDSLREKLLDLETASQSVRAAFFTETQMHIKAAEVKLLEAEATLELSSEIAKMLEMKRKSVGIGLMEAWNLLYYGSAAEEAGDKVSTLRAQIDQLKGIMTSAEIAINPKREKGPAQATSDKVDKIAEAMQRLSIQMKTVGFSDLDKEVISFAQSVDMGEKAINRYITAVKLGKDIDSSFGDLFRARNLIKMRLEFEETNRILSKTAPLMSDVSNKTKMLSTLVAQGAITADQAALEWADYMTSFSDYAWIDDATNAFTTFAESAALGTESVADSFEKLARSLLSIAWQELVTKPLQDSLRSFLSSSISGGGGGFSFGGLFGGLVGAFFNHDGGMAGTGPQRLVPAGAFAGAPRLHKGLMSDEFASVLQRGEMVLTKQQQASTAGLIGAMANTGGNTYIINAQGATMTPEQFRSVVETSVAASTQRVGPQVRNLQERARL